MTQNQNVFSTSDWIAIISLALSLVVAIGACIGFCINLYIQHKNNKESDERFNQQQEKLDRFQNFQVEFEQHRHEVGKLQFEIENQSNLIPYFHLNRTKSDIDYDSNDRLFVKIYLTNVGKGTATNITMSPISEDNGNDIYFKADYYFKNDVTHGFHDYFSENFAIPNESIKLEIMKLDDEEKQNYFIEFNIEFNDVIGRRYRQKFRFGYDNYIVKGINQDSNSYPPKLIKRYKK